MPNEYSIWIGDQPLKGEAPSKPFEQEWEWVQPGSRECDICFDSAAEALEDAEKHADREGGSVWVYRCEKGGRWIESEEFSWNANWKLRQ